MDYEKKYKDALERAKEFYILCKKCGAKDTVDFLEDTLPELAESEGDRIRKEILEVAETVVSCDGTLYGKKYNCREWIAWLEKQGKETSEKEFTFKALPRLLEMIEVSDRAKAYTEKLAVALDNEGYHTDAKIVRESIKIMNGEEVPMATMDEQKPVDNIEPKFKIGDWITDGNNALLCVEKFEIDYGYELKATDGQIFRFVSPNLVDANYHLWTIQDAKDGDVLIDEDVNVIGIFEGIEGMCWHSKFYYSNTTKEFYGIEYGGSHKKEFAKPATKEQHDQLKKAMTDAGYTFDFEKKELKKISQRMVSAEAKEALYDKPACSEAGEDIKEALRTEYEKGRADVLRCIDPDEMVADFCSQPFSKTRSIASIYRQGIIDIIKRINRNEETSITSTHSIDDGGVQLPKP